ncbi:hypothetical protein LCM10_08160 [Rossellomorea aquimaris]|uniref:CBO0543 family protein n=1 Tax=Rossellomorea aquimaris TaxID=189382 RepID=UPI001CD63335|nr:CBO0543 family protein [Rossellomorea aquimaris]MCA1054955.1 hypothetical protein [Rossellomorea aquimaris]
MFHAALTILILIVSIVRGKWSRWKDFLPTIYYFSFFNMFYQYISLSIKKVWELEQVFISQFITDFVYTFIAYPALVVMFLHKFPDHLRSKVLYVAQYILVSVFIEWIAYQSGNIVYFNGWTIWWTAFFYSTMYPMLYLHYVKPLTAYVLSFILIAFYFYMFDVSIL